MDKQLITGIVAISIAALLQVVLPFVGINLDLGFLLDGSISGSDLLNLAGLILVSLSGSVRPSVKQALGLKPSSC